MSNQKIKESKEQLGSFFKQRRLQMRLPNEIVASLIGVSAKTLQEIESGEFPAGIDTILRLCAELELKPFFAPLEELGKGSLPDFDAGEKFVLAPDQVNRQLYILHRQFPACLIQIIQTTPVTFRIVDLYDKIDEEELAVHPFLEEAKEFFKQKYLEDDRN